MMNPLGAISSIMGPSASLYIGVSALAVGLAGGFTACHYVQVIPMQRDVAMHKAVLAEFSAAAETQARTKEQETQNDQQRFVAQWLKQQSVRPAGLGPALERLRHPKPVDPGAMPEIHSAGGGPATCDDRLGAVRAEIDGADRSAQAVSDAAADALDAVISGFHRCSATLILAQQSLTSCESLTQPKGIARGPENPHP